MIKNKLSVPNTLLGFITVYAVLLIVTWFFVVKFNAIDDNLNPARVLSLAHFKYLFHSWSQRTLIDIFTLFCLKQGVIFCKIISVVMYVLFVYLLAKLFNLKSVKFYSILIVLIGFYNFLEMESVGAFTVLSNYFFPLVLGIFIVNILLKELDKTKIIDIIKIIILPFISIYALTNELLALAFILFCPFSYYLTRRNIETHFFIFAIAIAQVSLIFLSGASSYRYCINLLSFNGYESLSSAYKLYLGVSSTLLYYTAQLNAFFLFLCLTVILCLFNKITLLKCAICVLLLGGIQYISQRYNNELNWLLFHWTTDPLKDGVSSIKVLFLTIISILMFCLIFVGVSFVKCERKVKVIFCGLIVIGLIVRFAMAFSPTLYYSMARTFIFTNTIFLLASLYLLYKFDLITSKQNIVIATLCFLIVAIPRTSFLISDEYKNNYPYKPVIYSDPTYKEKMDNCAIKELGFKMIEPEISKEASSDKFIGCWVKDFKGNKRKCTEQEFNRFLKNYKEKELVNRIKNEQKVFFN